MSHRGSSGATLPVGVLMLAGLTVLDAGLVDPGYAGPAPVWLRLGLLIGGLTLGVVGLTAPSPPRARRRSRTARVDLAVVAIITGVALLLRVWQLDALRILIDEGNEIDNLFLARNPNQSVFLPPSQYVTTLLHPIWQALVVGAAGPTLIGLRLSSALLGAATVPAVYWLGRALYGRHVAYLAALILAVLPPHMHFSRVGLPHILDALFGTLALAGVSRGLRWDRRLDWTLSGVALGLTHYGFEAGRLFYTPLIFGWLAVLAIVAPGRLRKRRRGLGAMVIIFALAVLPLYTVVAVSGADVVPRWRSSGLDIAAMWHTADGVRALASHALSAARVYVIQPEGADFYGGRTALLLPGLVPFFLLGVALTMARPRHVGVIVPLSLVAVWLSNAAMRDVAVYPRWVVSLPAVALAVALGINAIARPLGRVSGWVAAAVALGLGVAQVAYYFGVHVDQLSVQARASKPYRDAYDAVLRAVAELPSGTVLVVISDPVVDVHPPRQLLRLLLNGSDAMLFEAMTPAEFAPERLGAIPADRNLAVFVAPDDAETTALLRTCLTLGEERRSPFQIAASRELALYFAAASDRRAPCDHRKQ